MRFSGHFNSIHIPGMRFWVPLITMIILAASINSCGKDVELQKQPLLDPLSFYELNSKFNSAYNSIDGRTELMEYSDSDGSGEQYYFMNWNLNGVISAWQATGDEKYLDDIKRVIDNTLSNSTEIEINEKTYMGWPTPDHPEGFELWDSMYWKEVATLLRIMHQSLNLMESQKEWFNSVLEFTEQNIWERYETLGADGHQFGYGPDDTSHWARIAMELYLITAKPKYITFFNQASFNGCTCPETLKGSSIRDQIFDNTAIVSKANNISWTWGETTSGEIPDVPHVTALVQFIALAAENRMYWNQGPNHDDIAKWIGTFNNVVWIDNSPAKGSFYIDGSGEKDSYPLSQGAQAILGRFDENFQIRMENYLPDNVFNKSFIVGTLLLNRKILDDGAPVYPENYSPQ